MKDLEENKSAFYELNLASINCFLSVKKIADHAANSIVFLNVLLFSQNMAQELSTKAAIPMLKNPKKLEV